MRTSGKAPKSRAHGAGKAPGVTAPQRRQWVHAAWLTIGCAALVTILWAVLYHPRYSSSDTAQSPKQPSIPAPVPEAQSPRPRGDKEQLAKQLAQANELLVQRKNAQAIELLTAAAKTYPDDEDAHYNLGVALARQGRFEESLREYEAALRIFPNYVEAHNNLGNVLMRLDRIPEAISHFEAAVKLLPDYASALNNLGTACQKLGRTNEALTHFQQAAKVKPDYWEAHFNIGTSCLQAGRWSDASNEFETVLRLKPDFQPARAALQEVSSRR